MGYLSVNYCLKVQGVTNTVVNWVGTDNRWVYSDGCTLARVIHSVCKRQYAVVGVGTCILGPHSQVHATNGVLVCLLIAG